jgi:hypothetical protein
VTFNWFNRNPIHIRLQLPDIRFHFSVKFHLADEELLAQHMVSQVTPLPNPLCSCKDLSHLQLSEEDLLEYQAIYSKHFGNSISDTEAWIQIHTCHNLIPRAIQNTHSSMVTTLDIFLSVLQLLRWSASDAATQQSEITVTE